MKKNIVLGIGFMVLALATGLAAQTPLYIFYDPACMQQLEYERVNKIDDLAHTDYYTNIADDKQLVVRVQKDVANLNRKIVDRNHRSSRICVQTMATLEMH